VGYSSKSGKRPFEGASKASHQFIINDAEVKQLIEQLYIMPRAPASSLATSLCSITAPETNPVDHIIAVDGGYAEAVIEKDFPSRLVHFLQFGALWFRREDLLEVEESRFIAPEDMSRLRNIERLKIAIPTRNVRLKDASTVRESVLRIVAGFFAKNRLGESFSLMDTLAWFIFRRYKGASQTADDRSWNLATNPHAAGSVVLTESAMAGDYSWICPVTGKGIYLTDIFRLHEAIEDETGATGILGYLLNAIEQLIIVHLLRSFLKIQPSLLKHILFIKDGPCGFFGQTANLYKPMRDLVGWLQANADLLLVGLEKSGAFVEHAQEIQGAINPGQAFIIPNDYIYRYIIPGDANPNRPYGSTTNYCHKVIFKTVRGQMHVVSIPVAQLKAAPTVADLPNLQVLLSNVEDLRCDMYDSALFPVALVNKLVSLSSHPSQVILQKFAKSTVT
jgi:hypothetical protein